MIRGFLILLLGLAGCAEPHSDDWMAPSPDSSTFWSKDCSGTDPSNGCDDCNPCTDDVWCDPTAHTGFSSALCVNAEVVMEAKCIHAEWTSANGVSDACFPIQPTADVRAGKCCAGQCVDNNATCAGDCGPITDTVLPSIGLGDAHAFCTACDTGQCDAFGASCESYGAPCDFDGGKGVCVACCSGINGELRCAKEGQ